MVSAKRGMLVGAPQWWRHLRAWKRVFWKRQRKAEQREIEREVRDIINKESTKA
jgi:hypothetical protein